MTPAQARRQLAMRRWKREWYRRRYQTDAEFRAAENAKSRAGYRRRKEQRG
jgi:hypothetical protein